MKITFLKISLKTHQITVISCTSAQLCLFARFMRRHFRCPSARHMIVEYSGHSVNDFVNSSGIQSSSAPLVSPHHFSQHSFQQLCVNAGQCLMKLGKAIANIQLVCIEIASFVDLYHERMPAIPKRCDRIRIRAIVRHRISRRLKRIRHNGKRLFARLRAIFIEANTDINIQRKIAWE